MFFSVLQSLDYTQIVEAISLEVEITRSKGQILLEMHPTTATNAPPSLIDIVLLERQKNIGYLFMDYPCGQRKVIIVRHLAKPQKTGRSFLRHGIIDVSCTTVYQKPIASLKKAYQRISWWKCHAFEKHSSGLTTTYNTHFTDSLTN